MPCKHVFITVAVICTFLACPATVKAAPELQKCALVPETVETAIVTTGRNRAEPKNSNRQNPTKSLGKGFKSGNLRSQGQPGRFNRLTLSNSRQSNCAIVPDAAGHQKPAAPAGLAPQAALPLTPPQPLPRPHLAAGSAGEAAMRPVVAARPLPQAILIDRRSAIYPYVTLTPLEISSKGDFLQLEDGSRWRVRHRHQSVVRRWNKADSVVIETGKIFTWSAYKLVNYSRSETVDVELEERYQSGLLSRWIAQMDPNSGSLKLQDGSLWRMNTSELASWREGDDVIIAVSKDWFSSHSSYVLINPRAKNRLVAIVSSLDSQ